MTIEKKTLEKLQADSTNALERYVYQDLIDADSAEGYIKDLLQHGCQSGMVSDLIYYTDTKAFYIKYIDEIEELQDEAEENMGEPLQPKSPRTNWLAWFGYEETARKIAHQLGLED